MTAPFRGCRAATIAGQPKSHLFSVGAKFLGSTASIATTASNDFHNKTKDWALFQNAALVGVEVSLG